MEEIAERSSVGRDYCVGAIPSAQGTRFRVWAPNAQKVEVVIESKSRHLLNSEEDGYFSCFLDGVLVDSLYKLSIDSGEAFPDPASRYQPHGPHGPSKVVDPASYAWSEADNNWTGASINGQVLYELHIGTFTPIGTFCSAIAEFSRLRDLGITVLEVMPLAEFPGAVGWGY